MKTELRKHTDENGNHIHIHSIGPGNNYIGSVYSDGSFYPAFQTWVFPRHLDTIKTISDNFHLFYDNIDEV